MSGVGASGHEPADASLFTPARRREAARIVLVTILTLSYWRGFTPFPLLLLTLAVGLYPLAKAGLTELWSERKIGTDLFVTVATVIAFVGGEYVAAAVLMTIILIAEYIAEEKLIFGVGIVHVLGIIAALQGWIGPIQAALLHLGPDVLVFLNSVKLLRVPLERAS